MFNWTLALIFFGHLTLPTHEESQIDGPKKQFLKQRVSFGTPINGLKI